MRIVLVLITLLMIPVSFAQNRYVDTTNYHRPGYFFLFNNRHYFPDYQEPRFFAYKYQGDCRCSPRARHCGCNPAFTQSKHFYRFYNKEGLSVEYYIR